MRRFILIATAALLVVACSPKIYQPVIVETYDSVRVEVRERVVRDTVIFEVPVYRERIVTLDTTSHLENPYAESTATVSGGVLTHELATIPHQEIKIVEIPVHDTVYIERLVQGETIIMEKEKQLTSFQRFQIKTFWVLVIALVLYIALKVKNRLHL